MMFFLPISNRYKKFPDKASLNLEEERVVRNTQSTTIQAFTPETCLCRVLGKGSNDKEYVH